MTQELVNLSIFVAMVAGLAFGNIAIELLNHNDRRRARLAWEKAWRSPR